MTVSHVKSYNVIDLFSGCGGLSCGFLMAGYKVLLGIDSDEAALKTFKFNHPNAEIFSADINTIGKKDILEKVKSVEIDVVIGGPPCQGFSLSGPRRFDDPRNKLYLSFMRIVGELKPKAFLIENVPGIMSLYGGEVKEQIIKRFSDFGYSVVCAKLNAADYGVPQLRSRVCFVGIKGKKSFNFPQPFLNKESYVTAENAISDLPPLERGTGEEPALYPRNGKLTEYQKSCRNWSSHIHNHIGTLHAEKTKHIISLVPQGGNYKDLPDRYKKTRNFHVAWTRFHGQKPAPTIDTGHRHHFHYAYNRVPTVRESARLQSFPDSFIFYGNKSQQYRQVGNAVPPLLAKAVAEELRRYL
jgi:DNA (cytosine-5)-methyltransferase 1